MRDTRYVRLDPTGNITCLVLDPVLPAEEAEITRRLMAECEQVAYLEAPASPEARGRIRLMGGEFCGNAAMAAAAWLAAQDGLGPGQSTRVPLEVSGAAGVLRCLVTAEDGAYRGTVAMPRVLEIFRADPGELFPELASRAEARLTAVRMEGILHLVLEGAPPLSEEAAEAGLKGAAARWQDEAIGLLQWREKPGEDAGEMQPLVYVRGSDTMVWETGCGSGSAGIGALRAWRDGRGSTRVFQPGGMIEAAAETAEGAVCSLRITGRVRLGTVQTLGSRPQDIDRKK